MERKTVCFSDRTAFSMFSVVCFILLSVKLFLKQYYGQRGLIRDTQISFIYILHLGKYSGFRYWRWGQQTGVPNSQKRAEWEVQGEIGWEMGAPVLQNPPFSNSCASSVTPFRTGQASLTLSEVNSPLQPKGHPLQSRDLTLSPPAHTGLWLLLTPQTSHGGQVSLSRTPPGAATAAGPSRSPPAAPPTCPRRAGARSVPRCPRRPC